MFKYKDKKIKVFADGLPLESLTNFKSDIIDGLTYNPTLFKNLKVKDYYEYSKKITNLLPDLPVSLEIIADDNKNAIYQAEKLSSLGKNVFIKIPITFTNGEFTLKTIEYLVNKNIKINITAIFSKNQIEEILPKIKNSNSILSVFAGRIYDIGIDAKKIVSEISEFVHAKSNCDVLWASPRMSFDIIRAIESNCDIITMQDNLINKLNLFGKSQQAFSLETVKMFYNDAKISKYKV